jgi:hypothetical protein
MQSVLVSVLLFASVGLGYQGAPPATQRQPATDEPIPKEKPTGVIEGRVLNLNTGAPLKKATIRLMGRTSTPNVMPNNLTAETDDDGNFVITDLEAGQYSLVAERQGYVRQSYGARKNGTGGSLLTLAKSQHVKDIVFKLVLQSVISGRTLDEDGEPMANVQVAALRTAYIRGRKQLVPAGWGSTTDLGDYRIANLSAGQYFISASARNMAMMMPQSASNQPLPEKPEMGYATTYYPNATETQQAVAVSVGTGAETRGIDIKPVKTRVFRIRGKVTNPSANIGTSARVMLMPNSSDPIAMMGMRSNSMTRPPDNAFELRSVTPGSYVLYVQWIDDGQQTVAYQTVEVGENHVDGLTVAVVPGHEVQGIVKVEQPDAPVALHGLWVSLSPAMDLPIGGARGTLNDDMKFTLKNVLPIRYRVDVSGTPQDCYVKSIHVRGQDVPEAGIELGNESLIEVTISTAGAHIDVTVVDKDGKPVSGATVAMIAKEKAASARSNSTDQNGSVTFPGTRPGEYKLLAWEDVEPGAYADPEFVKLFERQAKEVKLEASRRESVQLKVITAAETVDKTAGR